MYCPDITTPDHEQLVLDAEYEMRKALDYDPTADYGLYPTDEEMAEAIAANEED